MARRPAKPDKSETQSSPDANVVRARIVAAAFDLAGTDGWARADLSRIASAAGVSLAEVHAQFPAKAMMIDAFMAGIDQAVLAAGPADADDDARDRLFEVLMRRFDALTPHKADVAAVFRDCCDPTVGLIGLPCFLRSMAWMLEAAGLPSGGISGAARAAGLGALYANAVRVWLRDDTPDMAKTMAALDRGLGCADGIVSFFCRRDVKEEA